MNDEHFAERIRSAYRPEPQTASEAAAFRAAIEARIARRRRRAVLVPAVTAVAATAVLAWLLLPVGADREERVVAGARPPAASATRPAEPERGQPSVREGDPTWEEELIFASAVQVTSGPGDAEMLPDDYVAIASVFLGP